MRNAIWKQESKLEADFQGQKKKKQSANVGWTVEGYSDFAKSNSSIDALLFALYSLYIYIVHTDVLKHDKTFSFLCIIVGYISYGSSAVVFFQAQDEKPPPPVLSKNSVLRSRSDTQLDIPGSSFRMKL